MSLNQSRRGYPHVDPDLPSGRAYGYRDPHRHAQVLVTAGEPEPRRRYKRRTYREVTP